MMETVLREIFAEMKEQKKTQEEIDRLQSANVKHFFTPLGNDFFTLYGNQIFTLYGKEIFTLFGKEFFTWYGKQFFTSPYSLLP